MPLETFPHVSRGDVQKSEQDRLVSFAAAAGGVAGITALNYRFNAPGPRVFQKFVQLGFTGVEAKSTPTGRAALRLPAPSLIAYFLPTPIGFVPGEFYGAHPDVVYRTLGIHAGKKPIIFSASEERKRVFDAQITAERIAARALKTEVIFGRASGHPFRAIPPGPIDVTEAELAFLESLPAGLTPAQRLIPDLQARRADLAGSGLFANKLFALLGPANPPALPAASNSPPILAPAVPSVSLQPETIKPVNAKALANQAAAEGIRAALVHERADP